MSPWINEPKRHCHLDLDAPAAGLQGVDLTLRSAQTTSDLYCIDIIK
jgi:hypothetical protein